MSIIHRIRNHRYTKALRSKISQHIMFETIMENSLDSIYFKDRDSRFIYNNKFRVIKHGIENKAEMIGKTDFDYFFENNAKDSLESEQEILRTGKPVIGKIERLVRLDGETTWSSTSKYPLLDKKGNIIGTWGISRDITEYEKAKEAVRISEAKHKAMIENIADVIIVKNSRNVITYISPNIYRLFGWLPKELIGCDIRRLIYTSNPAQNLDTDLTPEEKGAVAVTECQCRRRDGEERIVELTAVNLTDNADISGILINFHDISENKKREKEIIYLSYHDTLTGLYNRAYYNEEKRRLDAEGQLPISVIMGDMNGLKLINDVFGHNEGDKFLIEIAKILIKCCRKGDVIARLGGDEFCILLPRTGGEEAKRICERIRFACGEYEDPVQGNITFHPSISLGYASKTNKDVSLDSIRKDAEDLMYKRKFLERRSSSIISTIKATLNEKSHETEEHSERMLRLSKTLGKKLNFTDEQIVELDLLCTMHDIGKIRVPEEILSKPGELTEEEWAEIRKHPEAGCRITQASELARVAHYILCHHERWDGTGYPIGLAGNSIPLLSRAIAIVDAYDAMTHDRPYRTAMSVDDAAAEIIRHAGDQFDPSIAKTFVEEVLKMPWKQHEIAAL